MGQTKKRHYDRYTLAFKRQTVRLADHPNVMATDIAEALGIHVVMLYRWRMEMKNGTLQENILKGADTFNNKNDIEPIFETMSLQLMRGLPRSIKVIFLHPIKVYKTDSDY